MNLERTVPLLRDLACTSVGAYGFLWQVTHTPDPAVLSFCVLLLSGPAAIAAWRLRPTGEADTTASPSPSTAASPRLPPSSAPSSSSAAGES